MIKIYSMVSNNFIYPEIYCPLIKGYLNSKKIDSKIKDFTETFISRMLNTKYIYDHFNNNGYVLTKEDLFNIKKIDECLKILKSKNSSTKKILQANKILFSTLNAYAKNYDLTWLKQGMFFHKNIRNINDLTSILDSKACLIFDDLFNFELNNLSNNDFIFINVAYDFQLPFSIHFSKMIKKKLPQAFIVLGGNYITHINLNIKELMKCFDMIDAVYYNSYPENILNIYNFYLKKKYKNNFFGYIRKNNSIISVRGKIKCKELFLVPCFNDYNFETFLAKEKTIPLIMNFGCYYNKCNFCAHKYFYNNFRSLNKNNLFKYIKKQYFQNGIKYINFVDECIPPQILDDLCNYLLKNKIRINWMIETRFDDYFLNKNNTRKLFLSGCRLVSFGLESYNNSTLINMKKGINKKIVKGCLKEVYNSGIETSITCMVGYPNENVIKALKTLIFIKKYKYIDNFGLNKFLLVRNSELSKDYNIKSDDLNLILEYNYKHYLNYIIYLFNKLYKIRKYLNIRNSVIHRVQYLYLDRNIISLNFRKDVK